MPITLENVSLVLSGSFEEPDKEDAKWALITRGAYVKDSVTKTTSALIVGATPLKRHLAGAQKHGTPLLDARGLSALLDGVARRSHRGSAAKRSANARP